MHEVRQKEFYSAVEDIVEHPAVCQMKRYLHHGDSSCYQHCLNVAYHNYQVCRFLRLDARSAARGGMLHDLFLYDWHTHAKETGNHFHGLTHPRTAHDNAEKLFELNHIEKDVILSHMWPVTILRFPRTIEGVIITITDKYCGAFETMRRGRMKKKAW